MRARCRETVVRRRRERQYAGLRTRRCVERACVTPLPGQRPAGTGGLADPDPMVRIGALDMLAERAGPSSSGGWCRRFSPIRCAACACGRSNSSPTFRPQACRRRIANGSSARQPNSSPPSVSTPIDRRHAQRSEISTSACDRDSRCGGRIPGGAAAQCAVCARSASTSRSSIVCFRRDDDGEQVLRTAIAASPGDAGLHHALGLALTRLKRRDEALGELRRATDLDPDRARYAYVYAVGLYSAGHTRRGHGSAQSEPQLDTPMIATSCWRS